MHGGGKRRVAKCNSDFLKNPSLPPPVIWISRRGMNAAIRNHMKTCHHCGNKYEKCFEVTMGENTFTFDCFECAIQSLAPHCAVCDCQIVGHGVESNGSIFCCAHCARSAGVEGLVDNAAHT